MSGHTALTPAQTLAENCNVRIINESAEYRRARTALLAEEIELRRHIERVAEMRRALPPGGEAKNYRFVGEQGPVDFADLFGDKQTLVIYTYMYGPQRQRPCPMCTSLLSAWDGEAQDIMQRVALAVIARSPIERLVAFKKERGWRSLKLYSDPSEEFSRDFHAVGEKGEDWGGPPRVQPARRHHPPLLERRDGFLHRRPRAGPARCARPHAAVDRARHDPGRPRSPLVPEARLRALSASSQ